jgi:HK97 family phage prohead protease
MQKFERRTMTAKGEVRLSAENSRTLSGHAAVFNSIADIGGWFSERIAPGAFSRALKSSDVVARWNHDPDTILGRTSSGTLRLREDERGLTFELDLPATQLGNDVLELVRRGDVSGLSFAFCVEESGQTWDKLTNTRTITEFSDLIDVSPVIHPAYEGTDIALRNRESNEVSEKQQRAARLLNRVKLYEATRKEEQS